MAQEMVIKESCSVCKLQTLLEPREMLLRISHKHPQCSHYLFLCPNCSELSVKPANKFVILFFEIYEIPTVEWEPPRELIEMHPDNGPITEEEIRRFRDMLLFDEAEVAALIDMMRSEFGLDQPLD